MVVPTHLSDVKRRSHSYSHLARAFARRAAVSISCSAVTEHHTALTTKSDSVLNLARGRSLAVSGGAFEEIPMKVNEGIHWIINCTPEFERTVAFFRDSMGLRLAEEGIPVTDKQFTRYALLRLPDGGTLEIVEPADKTISALYAAPVVCFKVDDLAQARRELSGNGAEFVAPIFQAHEHEAWTYFRAPDGHVYQVWSDAMSGEQGAKFTE